MTSAAKSRAVAVGRSGGREDGSGAGKKPGPETTRTHGCPKTCSSGRRRSSLLCCASLILKFVEIHARGGGGLGLASRTSAARRGAGERASGRRRTTRTRKGGAFISESKVGQHGASAWRCIGTGAYVMRFALLCFVSHSVRLAAAGCAARSPLTARRRRARGGGGRWVGG